MGKFEEMMANVWPKFEALVLPMKDVTEVGVLRKFGHHQFRLGVKPGTKKAVLAQIGLKGEAPVYGGVPIDIREVPVGSIKDAIIKAKKVIRESMPFAKASNDPRIGSLGATKGKIVIGTNPSTVFCPSKVLGHTVIKITRAEQLKLEEAYYDSDEYEDEVQAYETGDYGADGGYSVSIHGLVIALLVPVVVGVASELKRRIRRDE